jgi:hypothetical protein
MRAFPVGYRDFHPNPRLNYDLNRWLAVLPERELVAAAELTATVSDWPTVMLEHADRAEREGRLLHAAFG